VGDSGELRSSLNILIRKDNGKIAELKGMVQVHSRGPVRGEAGENTVRCRNDATTRREEGLQIETSYREKIETVFSEVGRSLVLSWRPDGQ
jgi:hypothetical protein